MKIYKAEPPHVIRVCIISALEPTEYFSLTDCTQKEVLDHFQKLLDNYKISPFAKAKRTAINVREAIGGKNGKSRSISLRGMTPKQIADIFTQSIADN